jgi:hypothetical protein
MVQRAEVAKLLEVQLSSYDNIIIAQKKNNKDDDK